MSGREGAPGPRRLGRQPGEVIDRGRTFTFSWDGREFDAYHGDTIVSALAAAGERVFSRSFKYHRPRGLLTASYLDPGCFMQVGDEPNVRGAHRLAEPGLDARPQNAWPSLRFDVKAANGLAGRFLSAGFYYKTFMRPRRMWPAYESVLQRFAAGGSVPEPRPGGEPDPRPGGEADPRNGGEADPRPGGEPDPRPGGEPDPGNGSEPEHGGYDKRYAHPDVLVAGGGPAGLAAALAAARAGASVLLVEEEHQLGGHLRWGGEADLAVMAELTSAVGQTPAIEVMTNSVVLARYDDNWTAIAQRNLPGVPERLIKARAGMLIVAAGLIERPYVFEGNDKPGVMLSTAARRLINLYAVRPGERAVVFTANADGDAAAADLKRVGVEVAHIEDARLGGDIIRARGRRELREVELASGRRLECDLLVTATGWTAPTALLNMAGARPVYQPSAARFLPDSGQLPANVLAAGGIAGDGSLEEIVAQADAAGREAARRALAAGREAARRALPAGGRLPVTKVPAGTPVPIPELPAEPHPALFRSRTHGIVDFCEDVSSKDLLQAVGEGYDSVELVKRYTTATMGPTQGKLETVNTVAIVAEATGRTIAETGTTTWRPPYAPVTLGALAGRIFEPVRYSPMQPWHEAHGARPLVAGAWIRPDDYGDPAAEARLVRERVGIIDVTPIGKLDLRGPDVPRLLNLLYVNKWSKLGIGKVRYGAMCAEDGVVLDDGVTGRLGEDHYLMSTTSSGAEAVHEWAESWLQTEHPDWQVHITGVTTAYASMNVAGPRSRELIERVTSGVDLDNESFGYMQVRIARIAGTDGCVLWRIGFTGELSYELHVPAAYGLHVWETLMDRGKDLGAGAFGVEAQRILRLEKGHLIVGQDTDGLTRGFSAGLDWAIKLDKDDFAGKPELAWQAAAGDGPRLAGVEPEDGAVAPPEASQIISRGRIAGRVTSSRMSPALGRAVCLAQLDARLAEPGTRVTVLLPDGRQIAARVTEHLAHVDPAGERMRV